MFRAILRELTHHAPFTLFGVLAGVSVMALFQHLPVAVSHRLFYILHPLHVFLSALTTASMYRLHAKGSSIWRLMAIAYLGSIGVATLSDSVIPYVGEALLNFPYREIHLGFVEKWWLVNPIALLGVMLATVKPTTEIPHSGHVLVSTLASLFHVMMGMGGGLDWFSYLVIAFFLFVAVWIPCCFSDIVFPLLFVGRRPLSTEPHLSHSH